MIPVVSIVFGELDVRDLIDEPLWRPEDLGRPIPDSPHAVSVCLPTWRDNIGYEEGEPRVVDRLQAGYPRFVYHPVCRWLFDHCRELFASESEACQVYPAQSAADRFCKYFRDKTGESARTVPYGIDDVHVVCYPDRHAKIAKDYWQHSGEGVSSRRAEACLNGQGNVSGTKAAETLRTRIAQSAEVNDESVLLFPCGMAATFAVYRALSQLFPGRKSVQFGFPYVDTLKIQQKFGPGAHLLSRGGTAELDALEGLLNREQVSGVFTEFPSNPLLLSPDLARLSDMSRRHGVPLIVDETVASFVNVNLLPTADVVCTSLTKFFSGVGDVMGGALILNSGSPFYSELSQLLQGHGDELLWGPDLTALERNSHGFEVRVRGINTRAEQLADFLREHPIVRRVYYPKFDACDAYQAFQRPGGGFGGLLSFTLREEASSAPRFFDALRVCKGPNLGMTYTLVCPYTILAHYGELDFAESCGMSRYLIRISVGLEDADDLIQRFEDALTCL